MPRPVRFKAAIYAAAAKLFGEKGLDATSIRQIAVEAHVSEAALYRHWKGKLDLAWDVFRSGLTALHDNLAANVRFDATPYEAIRTAVECFYRLFDENYQLFRFVLLHQHDIWSRVSVEERSPVTSFWFDLMKRYSDRLPPVDAAHPEVIAAITLGVVLQPAVSAIYGNATGPMVEQSDRVARAVCRVMHLDDAAAAPPGLRTCSTASD